MNEEDIIFEAVLKDGKLEIVPTEWVQRKINKVLTTWSPSYIAEHNLLQSCVSDAVEELNKQIINKIKYGDEYRDDKLNMAKWLSDIINND